jgi:hypothetical protein
VPVARRGWSNDIKLAPVSLTIELGRHLGIGDDHVPVHLHLRN